MIQNNPNRLSLSLREQADLRNQWLRQRLDTLLPEIMERTGIDLWLVIAREYNEDPVLLTLLPEPAMSARRRTILFFYRRPDGVVERLTLDRYGHGDFYDRGWDPDAQPDQIGRLVELIRARNPRTIGLNFSADFAFADGLSLQEYRTLRAALGDDLSRRIVSAEQLAIGWLERRLPEEITAYPDLVAAAHGLIARAFSREVVRPGLTTAADVIWWLRQEMQARGWRPWFQPTVEIQAPGQRYDAPEPRQVIQAGDLLHCDVGFSFLGLCTDHQQHAYVLRDGESHPPDGLVHALEEGKRLQDFHLDAMAPGKTGNEILAAVLQEARAAGLTPQVYSHPLGYHGHAAGPTIGLWDQQEGVPGNGDYPLFNDTCYSIELNVKTAVPEWAGQEVRIALEEDAVLVDGRCRWLNGRQEYLHII